MLHGVNIMISAIILLNTIYIKDAEEISIFPTLMLLLPSSDYVNVATTKLILADGSAGKVVDGLEISLPGNMVVGLLFYYNRNCYFLVITRAQKE